MTVPPPGANHVRRDVNDYEIIKAKLPIPFVMWHEGHAPVKDDGGKLTYHSPFREDTNPSFDVWLDADKGWRWGDFAEGTGGDVLDLLGRFGDPADAMGVAWVLIGKKGDWQEPEAQPKKKFNADTARDRMVSTLDEVKDCISSYHFEQWEFIDRKPGIVDLPVEYLYHEWGVRSDGDALILPYYDTEGTLTNYKVRTPGEKRNASGGTLSLYGLWRLADDDVTVVLVEGETDAWAAHDALGRNWTVLAIPGANTRPERVGQPIAGRNVVLAIDADSAGRKAVEAWSSWVVEHGGQVSLVPLPPGADVASLNPEAFASYFDRRSSQGPPPVGFGRGGSTYGKINRDGDYTPVNDWALDVHRVLQSAESGEVAFEGSLLPHNKDVTLPASALMSGQKLVAWCTEHNVSWSGSGQDHQKLAQLLRHDSFGMPVGRMTSIAGLHEGTFVWPDGHAGAEPWLYVTPKADAGLSNHLSLGAGEVDKVATIDALLAMYDHSLSTPLLAWLAAAPLRSLFRQFPFLYVGGTRGSGKTVTPATMMRLFNGSSISEVAGSTEHALHSKFASTNAFPIRIDEFRRGAIHQSRRDALMHIIRAAYDGDGISKGGQDSTNLSALTEFKATAPFILSGEDSLVDEAILDRAIVLRFDKKLRGELPSEFLQNLGFDYLKHLLSDAAGADLRGGFISPRPTGPEHLSDRQRTNLGCLVTGWRWLAEYMGDDYQLPKLQLGRVVNSFEEAAAHNPVLEAIRFLLDNPLSDGAFLSQDGDWVCIQPALFLADINRTGVFDLPFSNAQGLEGLLKDDYDAEAGKRMRNPSGDRPRVVRFDSSMID